MTIWSQKSALIQPRTSLGKSDVSWRWVRLSRQPQSEGDRVGRARSCDRAVRPDLLGAAFRREAHAGPLTSTTLSPRHITLSEARSRLYRRRFLQPNSHFAAFFKIYKICTLLHRSELKFLEKFVKHFSRSTRFS